MQSSNDKPRYKMTVKQSERNGGKVFLLFWNDLFGRNSWGIKKVTTSEEDLKAVNCSYTNCIFTAKKNLLPKVHDFDAIFFDFWWRKEVLEMPKTRSPRQLYIIATNE